MFIYFIAVIFITMQTKKQFDSKVKIKSLTAEQVQEMRDYLTVLMHEVNQRATNLFYYSGEHHRMRLALIEVDLFLKNKGRKQCSCFNTVAAPCNKCVPSNDDYFQGYKGGE